MIDVEVGQRCAVFDCAPVDGAKVLVGVVEDVLYGEDCCISDVVIKITDRQYDQVVHLVSNEQHNCMMSTDKAKRYLWMDVEKWQLCNCCEQKRPKQRMEVGGWWSYHPSFAKGIKGGHYCHNCSNKVHDQHTAEAGYDW